MVDASTSKEGKSTSSAIAEKIISRKPESSPNKVPSGAKVFSSFQVGKQHPKEEEYLAFTRYIYNLPEESGETFGVLGTTSLFPRISIFLNGSPGFTAQLFEFGYLDRVSTCKGFPIAVANEKIASLPKKIGGSDGKEIHAMTIEVSSSGSNKGWEEEEIDQMILNEDLQYAVI
ncbi:hypothetical protein H5410_053198 [Solanum commersonii]|uniref:Uncharacterized protein n=1 Tax=Solanum commersonii TaxID=4109 RepID=A0A9J5X371_SOLCO|nr:hypothetical protein H5410_053198 [Solanum commersonii]